METVIKPFQLGIAARLIEGYKGDVPFSAYFSAQAKLNPNWGSRDRKIYRQACYAYFRLGYAAGNDNIENNIRLALQEPEALLQQIDLKSIYPYPQFISSNIQFETWASSLLYQKPVYLAIVKGCEEQLYQYLESNNIPFENTGDSAVRLKPNTSCNTITEKGWAWIMDISSQKTAGLIQIEAGAHVWDCCSGAGGKALYLTNRHKENLTLTCSDARFSILENLKGRFNTCHLPLPRIELCDLTGPFQLKERYDIIVADVPCSGSGTWGRTPENITRTDLSKIVFYAKLQRTIIDNARKNLKQGGKLYYITCSVFKEENEANVQYFEDKSGLKLIHQQYINTKGMESDWLYCAEFERI